MDTAETGRHKDALTIVLGRDSISGVAAAVRAVVPASFILGQCEIRLRFGIVVKAQINLLFNVK